jgi:beta-aspartyl-peptidase (threonine type)
MQGYWKSPKLTFFSDGNIQAGWDATLERYRKRYQAKDREMGKLSFADLQIKLLGPEHALVRGRFKLIQSKGTPQGIFTLVLERTPDGWHIIHDHTSAAPPAAKEPSTAQ